MFFLFQLDIHKSVNSILLSDTSVSFSSLDGENFGSGCFFNVDSLDIADAGLLLSWKWFETVSAPRLTAEEGLCLNRSLIFALSDKINKWQMELRKTQCFLLCKMYKFDYQKSKKIPDIQLEELNLLVELYHLVDAELKDNFIVNCMSDNVLC